jgi:hypothetical protein
MEGAKSKDGWAAFVAGAGVVCYALIMLVASLLSISKYQFGHLYLIGLSLIMLLLGVGLIRHNYYAWLLTTIIALINVLAGFARIIEGFFNENQDASIHSAPRMMWPIIFLFLLYLSRKECRIKTLPWAKEERAKLLLFIKSHLSAIAAGVTTLATAIAGAHYAAGAMLIFGLPLLAFQFAIVYLVGSSIQKRRSRKTSASA